MVIFLPDFTGYDARDTLMDFRQIDHHDFILCHMVFLNIFIRFLNPLHCQILTAFVQLLQLPCRRHGIRSGKALQQFQRSLGCIQPAGCIQTGSQYKPQMIGAQTIR